MANKTLRDPCDILDDNCEIILTSTEFIPGRFYFIVIRTPFKPKYTHNSHFFTIDDELKYDPFLEDFGPLNLALLYRYVVKLNSKLRAPCLHNKKVVHYTTIRPKKRVNAAFLVGAYAIIYLNMHPNEVYNKLNKKDAPPFRDFRDASNGFPLYKISLLDCLNAIYQAHKQNFFNFDDFDLQEYEYYETVESGDLNWVVPNKFLAFAGPQSKGYLNDRVMGYLTRTPESYIKYFRENNVTTIIRLNNKLYDAAKFTKEGFTHKDLFFIDGSTPSDDLVQKFLEVSESTTGAVAVHCKAGLGRTGSMIACYIMKWYRFSAREAIAWLRICRPASIIGHQQEWLEMKQAEMWALNAKVTPPKHKYGIYSLEAKAALKEKTVAKSKISRAVRPLPIDNVSRIVNKVDSMSIDNHAKDENKNNQVILDKDSNEENYSYGEYSVEQGDIFNEIKAKRPSRNHLPKPVRKFWGTNAVTGTKRVILIEKLNMPHPKRSLTRSKSSQNPPTKSLINETGRINVSSAPPVKMSVPVTPGMTLRSNNRLYSFRHPRTSETRLCKATSVR